MVDHDFVTGACHSLNLSQRHRESQTTCCQKMAVIIIILVLVLQELDLDTSKHAKRFFNDSYTF